MHAEAREYVVERPVLRVRNLYVIPANLLGNHDWVALIGEDYHIGDVVGCRDLTREYTTTLNL